MLGKRKGGRDIGHPVRMILTADQNGDYTGAREDYTGARELVGDLPADARRLVADRGCDADRFRNA